MLKHAAHLNDKILLSYLSPTKKNLLLAITPTRSKHPFFFRDNITLNFLNDPLQDLSH